MVDDDEVEDTALLAYVNEETDEAEVDDQTDEVLVVGVLDKDVTDLRRPCDDEVEVELDMLDILVLTLVSEVNDENDILVVYLGLRSTIEVDEADELEITLQMGTVILLETVVDETDEVDKLVHIVTKTEIDELYLVLDDEVDDVVELVDIEGTEYCMLDTQKRVDTKYFDDVNILVVIIQYTVLKVMDA